ncbi:MAG: hypothetical protein Q8919_09410, partial [Bacteroidota bacterium]|nr:hypothetical protein [Bacteroidota bacterium]
MRRTFFSFMAIAIICLFAANASAQTGRILGARGLQLDDGNGNTITIQTPNGGWTGNVNYLLPQPPYPLGPSGWIAPGTLDGQIPVWDVALNSWQPTLPAIVFGFAANNEPFLTFSPAAGLTNSRILNSGLGISLVSSGAFPNASYTINNTGVLSNVAGAGISVSGATGDVVIDNTGVLSTIAGPGIGVSGPNGDVTISNTGVIQLTGTPNQVLVNGTGSIGQTGMLLLSTPQDIAPTSSPIFAGMTITGLTPAGVVHNSAGGVLSSSPVDLSGADVMNVLPVANGGTGLPSTPNNGELLIGNGAGYTLSTITGTLDEVNVANGAGSIVLSTPQPIATTSAPTFSDLTLTGKGTSASTVTGDVGTTLVTKDFVTTPGNVAVMTNSSLIGDGTSGNPLGLSLDNSNIWTADQLLPNSSTQGDNLISAVNASSNTINAVNIGNGLTDAQVNDNLTINGGTIDNTPIG